MNGHPTSAQSPWEIFLNRLTSLSANNRLIFLPRLSASRHLDLFECNQRSQADSFRLLEGILAAKPVVLGPIADARFAFANTVSRKLKQLQRNAQFIIEESGSQDLHVGWPMVAGKFMDGTLVHAPLLLFPVELFQQDGAWVLTPRENAQPSFNKSFFLALAHFNAWPLAGDLMDEDFDDTDRDSTVFRTQLYTMLQKSGVDINFNPEVFQNHLAPVAAFTREEFDKNHEAGMLKLHPNAVLGLFSMAGSAMVADYKEMILQLKGTSVESFFETKSKPATSGAAQNFAKTVSDVKLCSPFPSDIFQENVLKAVKVGHSVVVQGPPGTGKSQLICNLAADAIANKKNVLVVSQKRAALDVVFQRLHEGGFATFAALVHDFKADRKEIFSRLARQIENISATKAQVNSLDAIQLERQFIQTGKQMDEACEALEQLRESLYDITECGVSIKELYLTTSIKSAPALSLKQEFAHFKMDALAPFLQKLARLEWYAKQFELEHNPWQNRKPFNTLPAHECEVLKTIVVELPRQLKTLSHELETRFGAGADFQQITIFEIRLPDLTLLKNVLAAPQVFQLFQAMLGEKNLPDFLWIQNIQRVITDLFKSEEPEKTLETSQLGPFQQALHRCLRARKNIFTLLRWQLFSKEKFLIKRTLVANQLEGVPGLKKLEMKLDARLNLEHQLSKIRLLPWGETVPSDISESAYMGWLENAVLALRCSNLFYDIRNLKNYLPATLAHPDFMEGLATIMAQTQKCIDLKTNWEQWLSGPMLEGLAVGQLKTHILTAYLDRNFDALLEYDDLKNSLGEVEKSVVKKLWEAQSTTPDVFNWATAFRNQLALAWMHHLEAKHPELRMVSSGKLALIEQDLREAIKTKAGISAQVTHLRGQERMVENLEYNRLSNLTTYRDLLHETTKKKKIWPLRKLIQTHAEEVFRLMPLWLASPEAVSALFPLEPIFDLVIFDEASQCFTEHGLPAMVRANQVVVVGDKQQLQPGDFFAVRWNSDAEQPDLEVDSLLDLSSRHFLTLHLQGHYRSRTPALLAFSNRHFYQEKLQTLPDLYWLNKGQSAFEFVKVDGLWSETTNVPEAIEVARQVVEVYSKHADKAVGVITFNQPQQELVLDKIEAAFASENKPVPATLFVKNIENVQGDERDIIIFSVGYGPNKDGKILAQFGSLNQAGGENRLNVAITRAREKIIVVASIWPEQLNVDEAKNAGPKLLRQYLEFVRHGHEGNNALGGAPVSTSSDLKGKIAPGTFAIAVSPFALADVTLTLDGAYKAVILTDDGSYQNALSAKHHHALLPMLLEQKNWQYGFAYSRQYWKNPMHMVADKILDRHSTAQEQAEAE